MNKVKTLVQDVEKHLFIGLTSTSIYAKRTKHTSPAEIQRVALINLVGSNMKNILKEVRSAMNVA